MRLFLCVLVAIGTVCPDRAFAQQDFSSGNFMLPHCQHFITDGYPFEVWDGECGGVISTLMFFGTVLPASVKFCAPKGATQGQAGKIIVNYLQSHPEELHQSFKGLAVSALHQAWPCR